MYLVAGKGITEEDKLIKKDINIIFYYKMNSNEDTVCRRHSLVCIPPHTTPNGKYEYEYEVYQPTLLSDKLSLKSLGPRLR